MRTLPWCVLALAAMLVLAAISGAQAVGLTSKSSLPPTAAYNPDPAGDDIELPMPCGLTMVMRAVAVPSRGFLWDMGVNLGSEDVGRPDMGFYDRRYASAISGPFAPEDLPKAWRSRLPKADKTPYLYYFIGKYEVTGRQWRAVMEPQCAAGDVALADAQPMANISWYDALEFTRRYTEWLLKNHPEALPRFHNDDKNIAFLRLPTEAEWEYAARGGVGVPKENLLQKNFYDLAPGTTLPDYAVFRPEGPAQIYEEPQPVGSRKPNPLGLYDTAGNVAEMVMDTFHFSVGTRLHGSAGGFLRKGGGFRSSQAEILPGRREEVAFFQAQGAAKARDMGLRLVLSGINTPDGGRLDELKKEWTALGESDALFKQGENPIAEIDRLLAMTTDPTARENLQRLRAVLKDNGIELERRRNEAAENLIRTSVYIIETIRDFSVRYQGAVRDLDKMEREQVNPNLSKQYFDKRKQIMDNIRESQGLFRQSISVSMSFYRGRIDESANYPADMLEKNYRLIQAEFSQDTLMNRHLRENLEQYWKHVQLRRTNRTDKLQPKQLLEDLVPANARAGITL